MRNDTITITGIVATAPRPITTSERLDISSFRLASTHRRFDRGAEKWMDGETNWFTVTRFRHLANNVANSVNRGERIIVTGTLRVRVWDSGEAKGTKVEVEADAVGHDLSWGTSSFARPPVAE